MPFRLGQIQAAIFLTLVDQPTRLEIASHIIGAIPEFHDVDPIIFPLPKDAPAEIPQIVVENDQKGWRVQFSPARCDLFFAPPKPQASDDFEIALEEFQPVILALWEVLEKKLSAHSNRLGLVVHFESEIDNASRVLQRTYIKPGFAHNAEEIQFHYLQNIESDGFDLNCWVRLRSQKKVDATPDVLSLLVDVNTRNEHPLEEVDGNIIQSFLRVAGAIVKDNLALHAGD